MRLHVLFCVSAAACMATAQRWLDVSPGPGSGEVTYADRLGAFVVCDGHAGTTWLHHGADWRPVAVAVQPLLTGHALAYDATRGEVLLFGGAAMSVGATDETWRFDGREWRRLSPLASPAPRAGHRMTFHAATSTVVLFGGQDRANATLRDTWTWNGSHWMQRNTAPEPPAMRGAAMAYDPVRRRTVLVGGVLIGVVPPQVWEWDGAAWHAMPFAPGPRARQGAAMTYDPVAGACLLAGGSDGVRRLYDGWHWNGVTFNPAPPLPFAADAVRLATAADGRMLLTGASRPWLHDGVAWRPAGQERIRQWGAGLAHDPSRGLTLRYGGLKDGLTSDLTGVFDGFEWRDVSGTTRPPVSFSPSLAYDSARRRVLLSGTSWPFNSTWEWTGTWQQLRPRKSPPARYLHAIAYDEARDRVVLFGGMQFVDFATTTWEWDGSDWQQRADGQRPEPRARLALAYDASRQRTIAYGGNGKFTQQLHDTWQWDGMRWEPVLTRLTPPSTPVAMAFDRARGSLHLVAEAGVFELQRSGWQLRSPAPLGFPFTEQNLVWDDGRGELLLHWNDRTLRWSETVATISSFGSGCGTTAAPEPMLLFVGRPSPGNPATAWRLERLPSNALVALAIDTARNVLPSTACLGWLPSPAVAAIGASGSTGSRELPAPLPSSTSLRGLTLHAQAFVLVANGDLGVSAGVSIHVGS